MASSTRGEIGKHQNNLYCPIIIIIAFIQITVLLQRLYIFQFYTVWVTPNQVALSLPEQDIIPYCAGSVETECPDNWDNKETESENGKFMLI